MKILITGGSGFIGTNAIEYFLQKRYFVLNIDNQSPFKNEHVDYWQNADIMDVEKLKAICHDYQPDAMIHMAARADCDENTTVEEGYSANTTGTQNVLEAIKATPSIKRAIIVSSQFVCGADYPPDSDFDYHPVTIYGQSKVITEQLTRAADLSCCWTLVRPTNIWGPWHERYTREFWKIAEKGWYLHPGGKPVMRCYGYVGNLVYQLESILVSDISLVDKQVFYLSDPPSDIYRWASAFCISLNGKPARRIPRVLLSTLGLIGDVISKLTAKPFYITSGRVNSMTSDYLVSGAVEKAHAILGVPPHTLEQGVAETVSWLRNRATQLNFPTKSEQ
jgi:nucleoside-diphosphate-sugar epimerase